MSRRVPEMAIVVGVLFASGWLAFVLLVEGDRLLREPVGILPVVLVAAALCYPFAAWAVYFDDDPAGTFPPRPVAVVGVLLALVPALAGALGERSLFGLLVATTVALPPAAYALKYGESLPPARATLAAGTVVGVGVLTAGLLAGQPYLVAPVALAAFLGSVAVHDRAGAPLLSATLVFGGTALVAAALVGASVALGRSPSVALATALTVGFGGAVGARFLSRPSRW
ncbi:hypothetical protein [Haloarchaeobius iranensis]|uniref:Uncharacterized protein n=1 Tax=Haloarchaeobius iranensis TaxID=996166 RepID=A0A1H0BGR4_9EURY|nr:hypothetical protein [Haloarchaeobius iranensis]SDN44820.1 hypothetical protein SAMN05192554_1403 [Haloarchaeobius iranensis]